MLRASNYYFPHARLTSEPAAGRKEKMHKIRHMADLASDGGTKRYMNSFRTHLAMSTGLHYKYEIKTRSKTLSGGSAGVTLHCVLTSTRFFLRFSLRQIALYYFATLEVSLDYTGLEKFSC